MSNDNTRIARHYHQQTKHSPWSVGTSSHYLDWSIRPIPFKIYRNLQPIRLPPQTTESSRSLLSLLPVTTHPDPPRQPQLEDLSRLLYFSAGITKKKSYPGGEILCRAASCTGALYEIELYVVCSGLEGLSAGVYHFSPKDFSLSCLRQGDYRQVLVGATAREPAVAKAPVILVSTGTYWRNSWKYQARAYRHFGWDNGTILANLLTMCVATRLPAQLVLGFEDEKVNRLLDLDTQHEVTLSMVTVGETEPTPDSPIALEPLQLETLPLSDREVDYPEMREMHWGTRLTSAQEVEVWRGTVPERLVASQGPVIRLETKGIEQFSSDPPERVILRRASSRRFERKPISFKQFSTLLYSCSRGIPADCLQPLGSSLNLWYLIVHAVEDLSPGSYFFDSERSQIELLKEGDFRSRAAHLGLDQPLSGDASFIVFFLADLNAILEGYGNRGYRAAQLEAGILGGRLYLAACAQHLGATGLTFYDDEVIEFFSPHARGKSPIFLMAMGHGEKPAFS